MAHPKIVEFPMARPKIVRTKEEAAAVPLHLPIQVELALSPADQMHKALEKVRQAKANTVRAIETELALATKRVEQLRLEFFIAATA